MDISNENIVHVNKNGVEYIQFKKLLEYKNKIVHAYTVGLNYNYRTKAVRIKEILENDNFESINQERKNAGIEDYKKLCDVNGLDINRLIKPRQKHTTNVNIVKDELLDKVEVESDRYDNTDGLVTNKENVILATTSADCISLLFYDPVNNVIANVHSGWKGTLGKISKNAVIKMKNEFNCNPENIICCICPSIRKCHFEVEKDVRDLFYEEFKNLDEINDIIEETIPNKKWHIDTVLITKVLLKNQGLKPENIIDSKICSVCNSNIIHSCRAEKKKGIEQFGLNTAIIQLK